MTIWSQDVHRIFGGVVPELASRAHLSAVEPVVDDALKQAGVRSPRSTASPPRMAPGSSAHSSSG